MPTVAQAEGPQLMHLTNVHVLNAYMYSHCQTQTRNRGITACDLPTEKIHLMSRSSLAASADLDLSFSTDLYKVLVFDFNTFYGLSVCSMTTLNH